MKNPIAAQIQKLETEQLRIRKIKISISKKLAFIKSLGMIILEEPTNILIK